MNVNAFCGLPWSTSSVPASFALRQCVSPTHAMSQHPHASLEDDLQAVLERARQEGRSSEILRVISASFDQQPAASSQMTQGGMGAMTDASKRQRSPGSQDHMDPEWQLAEAVEDQTQGRRSRTTVTAMAMAPLEPHARTLPPGITSVQHWGSTICELPKVKSRRATYEELVQASTREDDLKQYMTKFILKHNGPSPKVADFRKYLEYIDFKNLGQPRPVFYPGSRGETRAMR